MRHMEDKRVCPHCGEDLHTQPYLMSRSAAENVLSWVIIAWVIVGALLFVLALQVSGG